ncbi:LolA family protein [Micromonospora sp. LOL_021]|uniref:LolA family protein n=1 Tax=Micromonospora sp. LOL_021 TaxID=3345417 RepID=UPI003A841DF4
MSVFTSRPAMRWLVPTASAAVLVGGGVAVGALAASADPVLPPRSAEQLLVDLQTAEVDGMSGTVVHRAELGLPAALNLAGQIGAGNGLGSLINGTQTLRVWYAGPDQARLAMVRTLGETDVIRNGRDVWIWSSQQQQATHFELPAEGDDADAADRRAGADPAPDLPVTPQAAADQVLAAIDPSTEVSVGRSAELAGRTAYELVLTPRDEDSLVEEIRIAIDSVEYVPLRFAVYPTGADRAAIETAFTQVSFDTPDEEQFVFNPPPGTEVIEAGEDEVAAPGDGSRGPDQLPGDAEMGGMLDELAQGWADSEDSVRTVGSGWGTVLVVTPPAEAAAAAEEHTGDSAEGAQVMRILGDLPAVDGPWGSGRLFSSALLTVLIADDGRLFAGAVTPERLYEVANETR